MFLQEVKMEKFDVKSIKYVIYARKSMESSERQVQSIDDQLSYAKKRMEKDGLKVVATFKESKSAGHPGARKEFTKMIQLIEDGKAQGIIAWKLDRLSRNPQDSGYLHQMMLDGKLKCVLTNSRDYFEDDDVIFDVESSMDAKFRKDLMKNVRRGLGGKAERGWQPMPAPIGYLNDRFDKVVVKDPETWEKVRMVWDKFLDGNTTVAELTRYADKTLHLKTHQRAKSGGKALSYTGIQSMLQNPYYYGKFRWKGELYDGKHPKMVSREEFNRTQELLCKKERVTRPKSELYPFIFRGILTCSECGFAVVTERKTKKYKNGGEGVFTYCHCSGKCKKFKCSQRNIYVREDELVKQVQDELAKYTIDEDFYNLAIEALNEEEDYEISKRDSRTLELNKALDKYNKYYDNLRKMRYMDRIDDETFDKDAEELEAQIAEINRQLNNVQNAAKDWRRIANDVFLFARKAKDLFDNGTLEDKQYVMRTLGVNLKLSGRTIQFTPNKYLIPIQKTTAKVNEDLTVVRTCDLKRYDKDKSPNFKLWYARQDLNLRPFAPQANALSS